MGANGRWFRRDWRIGLLLVAVVPGIASAQTTPPAPPQGSLPTPQQVTPPPPEALPAPQVSVDSRAAIVQRPCPFDDSPLRITLNTVEFVRPDGSPLHPDIAAALAGVLRPTGDLPIKVICTIRDQANEALRRGNWVASVQVPPQEITTGTLRLEVVAARITEVNVRGNAGPYEALLRERIEQLKALDPLNEKEAERLLLLAGDIPGLRVQLALSPAPSGRGDVIGDLIIEYRRFAVFANAQNYNSRQLGRETGYLRAEVYGLTGMGDTTYVGGSTTPDLEEQRVVQVGHIMTLGEGTTLGGRFSYAWSRPDLPRLDYRTETLIAGFDVTHSLVRSVDANLALAAGFDFVDQDTRIHSGSFTQRVSLDKLRVLYASAIGDAQGTRMDGSLAWSVQANLELRKGFDIFGSSDNAGSQPFQSRDGTSRAFLVRADTRGLVNLTPWLGFAGRVMAQWTDQSLLNYEEFSLGNLTVGRGYDPGSNSGDRAVGLTGEILVNLPVSDRVGTQVFGFYDYVYLDNLERNATETGRDLRSLGGGLRITLPQHLALEVTYAHPIDRALSFATAPPSDRLLLSLSVKFGDRAR
jgi:hemolysin activation/secretion protein